MIAPDWLRKSIKKGLQGLLMLRLQGAPAQDTIASLASTWIAVLANISHTWDEERDARRIQAAFLALAAQCERWPAPATFLKMLPPVPTVGVDRMLSAPRSTGTSAEFKEILGKLRAKTRQMADHSSHEPPSSAPDASADAQPSADARKAA